jgi:hypothetical protein
MHKKLFVNILFEEGLPVLDSVPAYKYSEYMAELNRRAWQLLEQRAFKPMSAARHKAVIAAGRRRLKKQRALVADLHMKVLADRGYEIDQLDRVIETKLKLIEMMSSQIAELKTERGALLAEQKRVQQKMHSYEVWPRKDHRDVDLISDALPFGGLWLQENRSLCMSGYT